MIQKSWNSDLDLAISVGCQDVGDVRQKGRGLYDPVMQNGCSVRAFDPIPIRPLEKESLWPFSLHFYTFRVIYDQKQMGSKDLIDSKTLYFSLIQFIGDLK